MQGLELGLQCIAGTEARLLVGGDLNLMNSNQTSFIVTLVPILVSVMCVIRWA